VADYSNKTILDDIEWEIVNQQSKSITKGVFSNVNITNGGLENIGEIQTTFASIDKAEKLTINLKLK